jgi:hypothetical protein
LQIFDGLLIGCLPRGRVVPNVEYSFVVFRQIRSAGNLRLDILRIQVGKISRSLCADLTGDEPVFLLQRLDGLLALRFPAHQSA